MKEERVKQKENGRHTLYFDDPSLAQQQFRDECDINILMKRYHKETGVDYLQRYQGLQDGTFGDFSDVCDYRTAIDRVRQADEVFMALPAQVRTKFDNDAAKFLDFALDPKNEDQMVEMGLAEAKPFEPQKAEKGAEKATKKEAEKGA